MKKLAIGCLVVAVVVCAIGGGLAYYFYLQFRGTVTQLAEFAKAEEIERDLRVRDPFTAPDTGELTQLQIDRFMRVQTAVRQRIGDHFANFEAKYKQLSDRNDANIGDLPALLRAYGEIASGWATAKRSQVDALNEVSMSMAEYRWIREQAYRAIGVPYVDLDFAKFAEAARTGVAPEQPGRLGGSTGPAGPDINRRLVEPFKKQLEEYVALATFGL